MRAGVIGLGTRASDRGRRWVVRFPGWLHRGVTGDGDAVPRMSAVVLYVLYVPLALAVEVSFGGWTRHPWALGLATAFLIAQAAAVWLIRPMPMAGWAALAVAVPASFLAYRYVSPEAGQALAVVLMAPVAWAAAFLPARLVALAVAANVAAVASLIGEGSDTASTALFAARALTLVVIGAGIHALVGSLRRAHDAVRLRADTDEATGTLSRSRMLDVLTTALAGEAAEDAPAGGLVLLDIDHFKRVNDAHGHTAGDDALRELVRVLRRGLRETDVLARWGGEEFLLFAPGTETPADLARLCEKLRASVASHVFTVDGHPVALTISLGAALADPALPIRELIAAADDALYQAKRAGRDRACLAQPRVSLLQIDATPTDLARIRGRVREAAAAAGLSDDRVADIALAVSEACAHLLRREDADVQHALNVTTHDRAHQFSVTIHDEAPEAFEALEEPGGPGLDIAVMTRLADQVQTESHGGESGLTIIFAKRAPAAAAGDPDALAARVAPPADA